MGKANEDNRSTETAIVHAPSSVSSQSVGLPDAQREMSSTSMEFQGSDTLAEINQAREAWLAEKQAAEAALDRRRQDLDRQTQLLAARLQDLLERERRQASLEAAASGQKEIEGLRQQVRDLSEKLSTLQERPEQRFLVEEKRRLEEQKIELQTTQAELAHLKEIIDIEFTSNRKILVQERLQIARMREGLRLERERFQEEVKGKAAGVKREV
jgi:hypothetical protein